MRECDRKYRQKLITNDLKEACKSGSSIIVIKQNICKTGDLLYDIETAKVIYRELGYDDIYDAVIDGLKDRHDLTGDNKMVELFADAYYFKINELIGTNNNNKKNTEEMTEKVKSMFDKLMPDSVLGKVCTAIVLFVIGKKVWKSKTVQECWKKLQDLVEDITEEETESSDN